MHLKQSGYLKNDKDLLKPTKRINPGKFNYSNTKPCGEKNKKELFVTKKKRISQQIKMKQKTTYAKNSDS